MCIGTTLEQWDKNPLLYFKVTCYERTGEVGAIKRAKYKGLQFIVVSNSYPNSYKLIIRGSIARYYNNGKDNAFDYNFEMLKQTINELCEKFNINPNTAIVQHLEIGANIAPLIRVKIVLSRLIAFQKDVFTSLKTKNEFNGKEICRQQYRFKVYDKSIMTRNVDKNLLRIELAIKSRKFLKKYNIEVLADILNIDNLNSLKAELINFWENVIFYCDEMQVEKMTNRQHKRWQTLCNPIYWEQINKAQRFRANKRFRELKNEFSTTDTQEKILQLLKEKFETLAIEHTEERKPYFTQHPKQKRNALRYMINP
ncbi:hypothetical protein EZY14_013445 [Kordia sp. TARA_039_SRF]|nr:hypothetical protein EZY14_013445 [Kordia sp. TARA_039_SRF]